MFLYKKKNGKKFDLKIARYRGLPYSGWTYQSETSLLSCLNSLLRISTLYQSPSRFFTLSKLEHVPIVPMKEGTTPPFPISRKL